MKTIEETLRELNINITSVNIIEVEKGLGYYILDGVGSKGLFTEEPAGDAISCWSRWTNSYTIECTDGYIDIQQEEWLEIPLQDGDYFSMVLTDLGEWCYYPIYLDKEERYRFDTIENERLENKLLALAS